MSFSAEMKDFLGGFQAGSQAASNAKDLQARLEELEMKKEAFKAGQYEALLGPEPAKPGKVKKVTEKTADFEGGDGSEYEETYEVPAPAAVEEPAPSGGMGIDMFGIKFAEGGRVPSAIGLPRRKRTVGDKLIGQVGPNGEIIPREALPVTLSSNQASLLGESDRSDGNPPPPEGTTPSRGGGLQGLFQSAENAIKDAMNGFAQSHNEQGAVGAEPDIDYVTGKGAATMEDIKAMDAKINPNGEISPWDMGRARLGEAYNYFVSQGQPQKAQRIAQQLLLYEKMASQTRGKLAIQMFGQGQNVEGLQMLVDAYNENIPNGNKMTAQITGTDGVTYEVVDENDQVVEQNTVPVQAAAEMAGNVANGSAFTEAAADIASKDELAAAAPAEQAPAEEPAPAEQAPAEAVPSAPAPDPAAAAAPTPTVQGVTEAPAAPATPAPTEAIPTEAAPAAAPTKKTVTRDRDWARSQLIDAAAIYNYYNDNGDDSKEGKAKKRLARENLDKAKHNALTWYRKNIPIAKKGTTNVQKELGLFEQYTMKQWLEEADDYELDEDPGLGAPPPAAPAAAAPAAAVPAAPATAPNNLRPASPEELADAKDMISSGKPRADVIAFMQAKGISTEGL